MNSSHHAATGYSPWNDHQRSVAGVQLNQPPVNLSEVAAQRYALLKAVADLTSRPGRKAPHRPVWSRVRSAVTKTA